MLCGWRGFQLPLAPNRRPRGMGMLMTHLIIPSGGGAIAVVLMRVVSVWWRGHVHMKNVARVCAMLEQQVASGRPNESAADVLLAVSPTTVARMRFADDIRHAKD